MTNQLTRSTLDRTAGRPTPTRKFPPPSVPSAQQPGKRRGWWVPVGVATAAVIAVVAVSVSGDDSPERAVEPATESATAQRPSYLIVQDYIDAALTENQQAAAANTDAQRPAHLVVQSYIDGPLAERTLQAEAGNLSAPEAVEYYVDAALAERQLEDALVRLPSYQIVQHYIDAALAENQASSTMASGVERPAYRIVQDEIDAALGEAQFGVGRASR